MNEKEFRTGVLDNGERLMQKEFDYVEQAHVTVSGEFFGDIVAFNHFRHTVNDAIDALTQLDKIKKSLFYGRDNNLISGGQMGCDVVLAQITGASDLSSKEAANYVHGVIGLATETGELLEALREAYNGKGVDRVNIQEEVGDSKWYMALLARVGRFVWGADEQLNIDKLRKRYAEKFTAFEAANRDLEGERNILEKGSETG